jgi:hypothetical protein
MQRPDRESWIMGRAVIGDLMGPTEGQRPSGTNRDAPARIVREYRLSSGVPALARLQGRACILCGRWGRLVAAGTVCTRTDDNKTISWDVRVCADHREAR